VISYANYKGNKMYHPKIASQFGADLFKVLGPKADRVPWSSLSLQEQESRLKRIPEYVNTRSLGKQPTLVDVLIFALNKLVLMGTDNPLLGIDLPVYSSLKDAADQLNTKSLNYNASNLQPLDKLLKNAEKQRDVFLRHIFKDIIFRFNPGLVLPGLGRLNSKGYLFVNDAQHRTLACMILGIEEVPINYIESDDEFWDVAQYAALNIHSLVASEFDRYRIRVQREQAARDAGMPSEPEDAISYELNELFNNLSIEVVEKSDTGSKALVLTSIGNMIKYRITYGREYFTRATTINAQLFSTSKFHTANSWGLMEFFKYQNLKEDELTVDFAIMNALRTRWEKKNQGGQLHKHIKDAYKEQTDAAYSNSRVPEEMIIAHGIWQVCKKYAPEIDWAEPAWPSGMKKFKLPLVNKKTVKELELA
jgi:hypothetical protein